jgi:hypothetical protein
MNGGGQDHGGPARSFTCENQLITPYMAIQRVLLNFAKLGDAPLGEFSHGIVVGMTGNAAFPNPPVTPAAVAAALLIFQQAVSDASQGGMQATAAKNAARLVLIGLLRELANYVQGAAKNVLATLLSSGFRAAGSKSGQTQLETPLILCILNKNSTQLVLRLRGVRTAKSYQVRFCVTPGVWQDGGTFTQSRRLVVRNLIPGTMYTVQARAVGGSSGYSDWSDPVSHMAM